MSLDINQVINQVQSMADYFKLQYSSKSLKLDFAIEIAGSIAADYEKLNAKIDEAKTTWLVPKLQGEIKSSAGAKTCPFNYVVVATDGSHIDVNRHQSAHCFLINIGNVMLQYGDNPTALLSSKPRLYFKDEEVVISSDDNRQIPIEGQLLGVKRNTEEARALLELTRSLDNDLPVLALMDGTLIQWVVEGKDYPEYIKDNLIRRGFVKTLSDFKKIYDEKSACIASYISFPGSTEVVNALKVALCPYTPVDCDNKNCKGVIKGRECDKVSGLTDRDIFNRILKVGERSTIFNSRSSILKEYLDNKICFFYIKLEDEVGRVEIPEWMASTPEMVDLVHSIILRQCELGLGYPVALMEAHEQAVVTGGDHKEFWQLVEQISTEDLIEIKSSAKQWSKKIRWI
jgi:hypothetical protein